MYYAPHAASAPARWGVVCTCLEPTQLVVAFAAHHLALGAQQVRLYLDAPQPDLEDILGRIPGVTCFVCDRAFWRGGSRGRRPKGVEFRQVLNAFDGYSEMDVDWVAHLDADEFLHADLAMSDILTAQPSEIDFVTVAPRERAFVAGVPQDHIFDGVFRRPTPPGVPETSFLFGKAQQFQRQGVLGYPHGKSFMRTGQPLVPGIHKPRRPAEHRDRPLRGWKAARARVLHFDGLTALHWSAKLLRAAKNGFPAHLDKRRSGNKHRARQVIEMRARGTKLENALDMHEMLKTIPQAQLHRLRALSLIEDYAIDPARDIAALNLGVEIDLSRAAFDRAVAAHSPEVEGWLGQWEEMITRDGPGQTAR